MSRRIETRIKKVEQIVQPKQEQYPLVIIESPERPIGDHDRSRVEHHNGPTVLITLDEWNQGV